jgi:hypothetical protein
LNSGAPKPITTPGRIREGTSSNDTCRSPDGKPHLGNRRQWKFPRTATICLNRGPRTVAVARPNTDSDALMVYVLQKRGHEEAESAARSVLARLIYDRPTSRVCSGFTRQESSAGTLRRYSGHA